MSRDELAAVEWKPSVAAVVGAGDALGAAIGRAFAREGYVAALARRNGDHLGPIVDEIRSAGGRAEGYSLDARNEDDVVGWFDTLESDLGPVEVVIHNIGANVRFPIGETSVRKYSKVWEMAAFSAFLVGREAARRMSPRERGTILFTGATASVRGGVGFAAFAGAKHAKRALAQSLARELGPKGIHVAHIVIDGAIDTAWIRETFPAMVASAPPDGILAPDAIAENYVHLHRQPRSAWTFEMDLRPWSETW